MKKFLGIFAAVMVIAALVAPAPASAFFEEGNLIQMVYNSETEEEWAADLGLFDLNTADLTFSLDLADYGVADWSKLYVGYFVWDGSDFTVSMSEDLNLLNRKATTIDTTYNGMANTYSLVGTNPAYSVGDANGYLQAANKNGLSTGRFGGVFSVGNIESSLANLAVEDVVMDLQFFDGAAAGAGATINTITTTAAAPVPVPGAVVLLASGLVGLVGIRRRNA